jgi:hypothetical protein
MWYSYILQAFGADISTFPNVVTWYDKMKTGLKDYDEINQTGANILGEMFRSKLTWTLSLCHLFPKFNVEDSCTFD